MQSRICLRWPSSPWHCRALKRALSLLGTASLCSMAIRTCPVTYGAIQTAFEQSGRLALMTVFRNDGRWDRSNVEFIDGQYSRVR